MHVITNSCEHKGRLVNQGLSWCNLKDENGKQIHPEFKCENCPDFKAIEYDECTIENIYTNKV